MKTSRFFTLLWASLILAQSVTTANANESQSLAEQPSEPSQTSTRLSCNSWSTPGNFTCDFLDKKPEIGCDDCYMGTFSKGWTIKGSWSGDFSWFGKCAAVDNSTTTHIKQISVAGLPMPHVEVTHTVNKACTDETGKSWAPGDKVGSMIDYDAYIPPSDYFSETWSTNSYSNVKKKQCSQINSHGALVWVCSEYFLLNGAYEYYVDWEDFSKASGRCANSGWELPPYQIIIDYLNDKNTKPADQEPMHERYVWSAESNEPGSRYAVYNNWSYDWEKGTRAETDGAYTFCVPHDPYMESCPIENTANSDNCFYKNED
ncbi:hypothetical protein [Vibrio pectenicida]|uniref:DUF1566 domain-containing protein n=1 Tax=Vibrio pectenicida TaxID=62763 RepID=A0A427U0D0_9VIBR|nr:hypothetical protein [Vibrio pectenicida]RSD30188.1 hypothetical protein EJA03_15275 [Vibrio pectenicida]